PQSGQPTGQRVHKPLMITKVFDKSSPLIFNALTSGERTRNDRIAALQGTRNRFIDDPALVDKLIPE
ncbi:type VI secretion system tube protein Hcp, partial [Pseudomonas otitidis]